MVETEDNVLTGHKAKFLGHSGKLHLLPLLLSLMSLGATLIPRRGVLQGWGLYVVL